MPDHATRGYPPGRGVDAIELGERVATRPSGPKNWRRSDDRIHDEVCASLSDDSWVDASDLSVTVHDGEVMLSGTVHDRRQRERAVRIAESIRGVVDVLSRVRVRQG